MSFSGGHGGGETLIFWAIIFSLTIRAAAMKLACGHDGKGETLVWTRVNFSGSQEGGDETLKRAT